MKMKSIPYGRQYISDEDISEMIKVLKSDYITQGPKNEEFEEHFAKIIGPNTLLLYPMVRQPCIFRLWH